MPIDKIPACLWITNYIYEILLNHLCRIRMFRIYHNLHNNHQYFQYNSKL